MISHNNELTEYRNETPTNQRGRNENTKDLTWKTHQVGRANLTHSDTDHMKGSYSEAVQKEMQTLKNDMLTRDWSVRRDFKPLVSLATPTFSFTEKSKSSHYYRERTMNDDNDNGNEDGALQDDFFDDFSIVAETEDLQEGEDEETPLWWADACDESSTESIDENEFTPYNEKRWIQYEVKVDEKTKKKDFDLEPVYAAEKRAVMWWREETPPRPREGEDLMRFLMKNPDPSLLC